MEVHTFTPAAIVIVHSQDLLAIVHATENISAWH